MPTCSFNFFLNFALCVRTLVLALALLFSLCAAAQQTSKPMFEPAVYLLVMAISNTANKARETADVAAVTVGRSVQQGNHVVDKEILKNGQVVRYAVTNFTTDTGNLLKGDSRQSGAFDNEHIRRGGAKDCSAAAVTSAVGNMGATVCALGRVVVTNAQKAFASFAVAESTGAVKMFFSLGAASHAFPSTEACGGIREFISTLKIKVTTSGCSADTKAAEAVGKSNVVALVAEELRTIYKFSAAGARYK